MILPFTFGLALGLMIAGVFYIAWNAERRVNEQLREHFAGEEGRNDDSFRAGMRMGHTAAQIDNLVFFPEANTPEPGSSDASNLLDELFPGSTPSDFPRPRGVITYPTDAA